MAASAQPVTVDDVRAFWDAHPCGGELSAESDRRLYYAEIAEKRYRSEPHIPRMARFADFAGCDVLEIGCGLGTDGVQFARNGARYTGVDLTPAGVEHAREQFAAFGVEGRLLVADAGALPFDESFDHVYSYGVIHHSPHTEQIVDEIFRVLRPGGTVTVMVYNRSSINYYVEIMFLRRALRYLLLPRFMPRLVASATGLSRPKLEQHRLLLKTTAGGFDRGRWLSANTDGPDCPLAKVYSAAEAGRLFSRFEQVRTDVWYFDRSHWPLVGRLLPARLAALLGRRAGWHRVIYARKPSRPPG